MASSRTLLHDRDVLFGDHLRAHRLAPCSGECYGFGRVSGHYLADYICRTGCLSLQKSMVSDIVVDFRSALERSEVGLSWW